MAAPFKAQVAVVAGILVMTVLLLVYFTLPERKDDTSSRIRVGGVTVVSAPGAQVRTAPTVAVVTSRFLQPVEITPDAAQGVENWTAGTLEGKPVWLDNQSGMVWGPKLAMNVAGFTNTDLDQAKAACAAETPPDTWALPTAAEFDIAKVNGLLKADSDARHAWISYQTVSGLEIPSGRIYNGNQPERRYAVRCVARTDKAPVDGYPETTNEITLQAMTAP